MNERVRERKRERDWHKNREKERKWRIGEIERKRERGCSAAPTKYRTLYSQHFLKYKIKINDFF